MIQVNFLLAVSLFTLFNLKEFNEQEAVKVKGVE